MKIVKTLGDCDIILFCGPPLSGKTYLYNLISQHIPLTRVSNKLNLAQGLILGQYALDSDNSVAVDNNSASLVVRQRWIDLARRLDKSIGLIFLNIPESLCKKRALDQLNKMLYWDLKEAENKAIRLVEDFFRTFERPTEDELDFYDYAITLDSNDLIGSEFNINTFYNYLLG